MVKTHLAIGLSIELIHKWKRVYFITVVYAKIKVQSFATETYPHRLLHKAEVVHLIGDSHRLKNRDTIF